MWCTLFRPIKSIVLRFFLYAYQCWIFLISFADCLFLQMLDINKKIRLPSKPHFEYFNNKALWLWDYESFKKPKTTQEVRPPKNKRIRANYKESIKNIRNISCVNGEMKDHLNSLIKVTNSEVALNEYCKLTWSINLLSFIQGDKGKNQVIAQYINQRDW